MIHSVGRPRTQNSKIGILGMRLATARSTKKSSLPSNVTLQNTPAAGVEFGREPLLSADPGLNIVFFGILPGCRLYERIYKVPARRIKTAHQAPSRAWGVPLLNCCLARSFVVCTRQLHRRQHPFEAKPFNSIFAAMRASGKRGSNPEAGH